MTTLDRDSTLESALTGLADATRQCREAAEAHARLRQALVRSSKELRAAQQARDDAVRRARVAGSTYRELEAVTGYSRAWLDRIVSHRLDRHARHR